MIGGGRGNARTVEQAGPPSSPASPGVPATSVASLRFRVPRAVRRAVFACLDAGVAWPLAGLWQRACVELATTARRARVAAARDEEAPKEEEQPNPEVSWRLRGT